jgi:hypothetical protein
MKKLILSALLISALTSCSTDGNSSSNSTNNDCNCGKVIECTNFFIPNQNFTLLKVKNNCTGIIKTVNVPEAHNNY